MGAVLPQRPFTVNEFHRLGEVGIREAWLVDLPNRLIEVFHDPSPESGYTQSASFSERGSAESIGVSGRSVQVDDVLG